MRKTQERGRLEGGATKKGKSRFLATLGMTAGVRGHGPKNRSLVAAQRASAMRAGAKALLGMTAFGLAAT